MTSNTRLTRAISACFLVACVMLSAFAAGCSSNGFVFDGGGAASPRAPQMATTAAAMAVNNTVFEYAESEVMDKMQAAFDASADFVEGYFDEYAQYDEAVDGMIGDIGDAEDAGGNKGVERKEIKNITCTLVVKDVPAAYAYLSDAVTRLGGYEFSKSEYQRGDYVYYNLTIKLPPRSIPAFEKSLRSVEGGNTLQNFSLYSDDITSAYYDAASRLDSMKASMLQYRALLSKAVTVKDMLEIQREITSLQADIDSLQGQINMWNNLISYATVDVSIERASDPIAQTEDQQWSFNTPSEILNAMGNGFISTGNVVYQVLVGFVVVVISLIPALAVIGLVIVIILLIRRKVNKNKPRVTENAKLRKQRRNKKGAEGTDATI